MYLWYDPMYNRVRAPVTTHHQTNTNTTAANNPNNMLGSTGLQEEQVNNGNAGQQGHQNAGTLKHQI